MPSIVILSGVWPDSYNQGYQDLRFLVVDEVNGRKIRTFQDLAQAFESPVGRFHEVNFKEGDSVRRIVLDAEEAETATRRIIDTYRIHNARGELRGLVELFAPHPPPGGAGDCAGPKLLAYAYAHGLEPIAMAEFWWGHAPPAGGRQHGLYYPACRGRCSKILPFMLEGIEHDPEPDVGLKAVSDDAPWIIHEDDALLVVHKPAGLLSVPARRASLNSASPGSVRVCTTCPSSSRASRRAGIARCRRRCDPHPTTGPG